MKNQSLLAAFLMGILIGGVVFFDSVVFVHAQTGTNVSGVIGSDAVWTKANSPYTFTSQVTVARNVTLTIEPGTQINLRFYTLQVNGTLSARGNSSDKIVFYASSSTSPRIYFEQSSSNWSETERAGSIIENAQLSFIGVTINNVSPKIFNSSFNFTVPYNPVITIVGGAPVISNNVLLCRGDGVSVAGGAAVIANNTIKTESHGNSIIATADVSVYGNTVSGGSRGIMGSVRSVRGNVVSDTGVGIDVQNSGAVTIEGNLVVRNTNGIYGISGGSMVTNNTVADNRLGIVGSASLHSTETVIFNNLRNNETDIKSWNSNIEAAYNWWGTTDQLIINQTIYDVNDDRNLGRVSYLPFLTSPNTAAPAYGDLIQTQVKPQIPSQADTTPPSENPKPSWRKPSTMTVSCFGTPSYANNRVDVSGTIISGVTRVVGAFLILSYSVEGSGTWSDFAIVQTDDIGIFTSTWFPPATGSYLLRGAWTGDLVYEGANATVSLAVNPFEERKIPFLTSNSILSGLAFNPDSRELRLSTAGPDGTAGYVDVYISKQLATNISTLAVTLDGAPLAYTYESQGEIWVVSFTYGQSSHEIVMTLGPEPVIISIQTWPWTTYASFIVAAGVIVLPMFFVVRRARNGKQQVVVDAS